MRPKTKLQNEVASLSGHLPEITDTQKEWAKNRCFSHLGKRTTKGEYTCLECGHRWSDKHNHSNKVTCPRCSSTLEVTATRQRVFKQSEYCTIVTTCKGFQVVRHFFLQQSYFQGYPAVYTITEVVQFWLSPEGKFVTRARLRPMSSWTQSWLLHSDLEVRHNREFYDIIPIAIYPHKRVLPILKRNGYRGNFCHLTPFELFHALLTNSKAETLLKAGQHELLRYLVRTKYIAIELYWASIRICIRNSYTIEDGSLWCDLLRMLHILGKDLRSPKYICPTDLQEAHDQAVKALRRQREQEEQKKRHRQAVEAEALFREQKSPFFGIAFTDGTIQVRVLESVQEYLEEGTAMHHCLFASEYHLKPNSLILSATINGKRIETIELNLETLKVVQSRGVSNSTTEYHDQILQIVQRNIEKIAQRLTT
nr:PcfJ domain-containing protein [uncultured Porphyromonas sp.]